MECFHLKVNPKEKSAKRWALKVLTHSGFLSELTKVFSDSGTTWYHRCSAPNSLSFGTLFRSTQACALCFFGDHLPKITKYFSQNAFLQVVGLIGAAGVLEKTPSSSCSHSMNYQIAHDPIGIVEKHNNLGYDFSDKCRDISSKHAEAEK